MEYLIVIGIILIYSSLQTIIFKKKIEQIIPISVVEIVLIIYLTGMFDNLKLGVIIVEIMAIIQLAIILYIFCKQKEKKQVIEIIKRILTPGLVVYTILCSISIVINKGRIFLDYDEFNHWARIIKNMFMYNTYGTNSESMVIFNEYPPFTSTFQYLFLAIKNMYSEDIVTTAQNILYISLIIPTTKDIGWNNKIKNLILIIPFIILLPMIFYKNFYLNILVDGMLGITFALTVFYSFEREENNIFKFFKILSTIIILCLTKTSGIALALLTIIIILVKAFKDKKKKEIIETSIIILLATILTFSWYIKVDSAEKRWNFNQYIETENKTKEEMLNIAKTFGNAIFYNQNITDKNFTVFAVFFILICTNFYVLKKQNKKEYKYYSIAMLTAIPIYLMSLMITYMTIFDLEEAQTLTSFNRYCSTILLANGLFQFLGFLDTNKNINIKQIVVIFTVLISILPQKNIYEKYIESKNYILTSNINRDIFTKLKMYKNKLNKEDSILYITGTNVDAKFITSMNQYEIMPIKISNSKTGVFSSEEDFINMITDGGYTHLFIYRMQDTVKEKLKNLFEDNYVGDDILYKISKENGKIFLERVR